MQDPLKQGLKQRGFSVPRSAQRIRMQDPLKQGLKPYYSVLDFDFFFYSNARSIKTRIETISCRGQNRRSV